MRAEIRMQEIGLLSKEEAPSLRGKMCCNRGSIFLSFSTQIRENLSAYITPWIWCWVFWFSFSALKLSLSEFLPNLGYCSSWDLMNNELMKGESFICQAAWTTPKPNLAWIVSSTLDNSALGTRCDTANRLVSVCGIVFTFILENTLSYQIVGNVSPMTSILGRFIYQAGVCVCGKVFVAAKRFPLNLD